MAFAYPQDTEEFKKERESYQLLFFRLNAKVWAPNGSDNTDHGMDYGFEYIEDGQYKGFRIYSQIKSTEHINKSEKYVSFDLKVKTAAYAISSAQPFVLFIVDLVEDVAYYSCLQDFFINNPASLKAVSNNKSTVRIKVPLTQTVTRETIGLQEVAKSQYSFAKGTLKKTR